MHPTHSLQNHSADLMDSQIPQYSAVEEDFEPRKPQRTNSWEKVIVFDPESNDVDIRTRRKVDGDRRKNQSVTLPLRN